MSDLPAYEIDHGEPSPATPAAPPPPPPPPGGDPAARAALDEALQTVAQAGRGRGLVDLHALVLAGLCGAGLGALTRIETWDVGSGVLAAAGLGALAAVAVAWRWARQPGEELGRRPLPAPVPTQILADREGAERARLEARNQADIAAIALLAGNAEARGLRLRRAVRGAAFGAALGLVVAVAGIFAPAGAAFSAVGIAATVAAAAAWQLAGRPWPAALPVAGVPGAALVAVLVSGGGIMALVASVAGAVVAGAVAWTLRRPLAVWLGC